jgi:hypothetical protein
MITLDWPATPLTEQQWRNGMEALAEAAEKMIGRTVNQRDLAQLALHWVGLAWPAIGPETIAASCRASLLVGAPGVIVATTPADQLAEIHERLDRIWEQAQADPAAAVLEVQPPRLELPPPAEPRRRRGRTGPPKAEVEPEPDPLQPAENTMSDEEFEALVLASDHGPGPAEPEPAPAPRREPRPLRPASERMAARPPAPAPAPPPRVEPPPLPEHLIPPPAPEPEPELTPAPRREPRPRTIAPAPPPPGWFTAAEAGELLGVEPCSIARWRKSGRLGEEGTGWQRCGQAFFYSAAGIEQAEQGEVPPGLDALVADVQAA